MLQKEAENTLKKETYTFKKDQKEMFSFSWFSNSISNRLYCPTFHPAIIFYFLNFSFNYLSYACDFHFVLNLGVLLAVALEVSFCSKIYTTPAVALHRVCRYFWSFPLLAPRNCILEEQNMPCSRNKACHVVSKEKIVGIPKTWENIK